MKYSMPVRDSSKSLYIYTVPKAGTYLLSSLCETYDIANSGYHIGFGGYLDTRSFSARINRTRPSLTRINQQYIKTFKQITGQLAFGHLSPSFLPPGVFHTIQVITSYRDPYEVLISEFNDFRFIRKDVKFCSTEVEPDDVIAFSLYLQRQAVIIHDIMIEMSRYLDCFSNSIYAKKYAHEVPVVINYNNLGDRGYLSWLNTIFANFLIDQPLSFEEALKATFKKETKTKSKGYTFSPNTLWTPANYDVIKPFHFKRLYRRLVEQESSIRDSFR